MKNTNEKKRDEFRSGIGFIIACIGSAVGMGNIWMFPYRTGKFGGSAFLIPYFIFVILLGFTGVIGEMAFGRSMKTRTPWILFQGGWRCVLEKPAQNGER